MTPIPRFERWRTRTALVARFAPLLLLLSEAVVSHAGEYETRLAEVSADLRKALTGKSIRTLAVLPFTDVEGHKLVAGAQVAEDLSTLLFNTGGLRFVERQRLAEIMKELKLAETGAMDASTVQKIGRLAGADAVLTGTLSEMTDALALNARVLSVATAEWLAASRCSLLKDTWDERSSRADDPSTAHAAAGVGDVASLRSKFLCGHLDLTIRSLVLREATTTLSATLTNHTREVHVWGKDPWTRDYLMAVDGTRATALAYKTTGGEDQDGSVWIEAGESVELTIEFQPLRRGTSQVQYWKHHGARYMNASDSCRMENIPVSQ